MIDTMHIDAVQIHGTAACGVRTLNGLGSPMPRRAVSARATRHGAIDSTRYYDGRVLELEGIIPIGDDPGAAYELLDEIKGSFALGSTRLLRFRRTGFTEDEVVGVRVASELDVQLPLGQSLIRYGVSLHAPDPRIYTTALRFASYDPTDLTGGGMDVPVDFPLVFYTTTVSLLEVTNNGNFSTPPIIGIIGPVQNPAVDNYTVGGSYVLDYNLGAGQVILIEGFTRTVRLGGVPQLGLIDAANTTWWELAPGTNQLALRGSGMLADTTQLTVGYFDARI